MVTAFVVYDGVLTLFREVQLFWGAKSRTLPGILYFSNKYLNILAYTIGMLLMASVSDKVCTYVLRCIDIARRQQR